MTAIALILGVIIVALALILWALRRESQTYARARRRKARRMRQLRRKIRRENNA